MALLYKVKTYRKRNGTVVNEHKKPSGRPIEWGGVSLGNPTAGVFNPDDPQNTPQGTLVAWVTEHDENGEDLSADGDGGLLGVIHARRTTIGSVVRQYINQWKRSISFEFKHDKASGLDTGVNTNTRALLVDIQKVEGDNLVSVPDACYEVGIDWVDEDGVQMPRLVWLRKHGRFHEQ